MYLFDNYKDIEIPGKLKSFLQDLYSGKLHRYDDTRLDVIIIYDLTAYPCTAWHVEL